MSNISMDRSVGQRVFGQDVDGYQEGRPGYPDDVFTLLKQRCGLGPESTVFEIGPGTGQATRRLLAMGVASLVVIEPDERLASHLTDFPNASRDRLHVRNESFETTQLPCGEFDLGIAATSFHWLENDPALAKVKKLLKPGGWWAMWWNVLHDLTGEDPFSHAILHIFEDLQPPPSLLGKQHYALETADRLADLDRAGFVNIRHDMQQIEQTMSPIQLRALYATFSMMLQLDPVERARRLDRIEAIATTDFGGQVDRVFQTPIYTAQKPQ